MAEIHCEYRTVRHRVGSVGFDCESPDSETAVRRLRKAYRAQCCDQIQYGYESIATLGHWRRSRMRRLAGDDKLPPLTSLDTSHYADRTPRSFQAWPLLDVRFEVNSRRISM